LIHSISKDNTIEYRYTNYISHKHFGKSKIILSDSFNKSVKFIYDKNGVYGLTNHTIGIQVSTDNEARKILNALQSQKFSNTLQCLLWSQYQIDWRIFTQFKRTWYEHFQ
jgi:hypothetical protein